MGVVRNSAPKTFQLLHAIRRRVIVVRLAESTGVALAVAAVLALVLLPILYWRGESGMSLVFGAFAVGALAGAGWAGMRWPKIEHVAAWTDRQLGLEDLLGTVVGISASQSNTEQGWTEPWTRTVIALAEDRCQRLTPGHLVVRRLDARVWGGIGLAVALALTVGMLTSQVSQTRAQSAEEANGSAALSADQSNEHSAGNASQVDRSAGKSNQDEISNRNGNDLREQTSDNDTGAKGKGAGHSATGGNGTGSGASVTAVDQKSNDRLSGNGTRSDASTGVGAGWNGIANGNGGGAGDGGTGMEQMVQAKRGVAPWKSGEWEQDRSAANAAIDSGKVPDDAADLVRDYFRKD
jgi:hypothetical protein